MATPSHLGDHTIDRAVAITVSAYRGSSKPAPSLSAQGIIQVPSAANMESSSVCLTTPGGTSSMRNPVAHQVQVIATGARPTDGSAKRELFTEPTSTVLVFENGAVIRLTASVASGQLLFLTNQESKREVVAQVTRKRILGTTSCYVELEFTEPAPGFWGIEFPAAAEADGPDPRQTGVFELVQQAEVTSEIPSERGNAPTSDEIDLLKGEVGGLREQLQSLLQSQSLLAVVNSPAIPSPANASPAAAHESAPVPASGPAPLRKVGMQLPTADSAYNPPPPASDLNLQKPATSFDSDENFSEEAVLYEDPPDPEQHESSIWSPALIAEERKARSRSRILLIGLLAALLVVSTAAASYMHWLPQPKFLSRTSRSNSVLAAATPSSANTSPFNAPVNDSGASQPVSAVSGTPDAATAPPSNSAPDPQSPDDSLTRSASAEKMAPLATSLKRLQVRHLNDEAVTPTPAVDSAETPGVVPPKLLQSVRPVPPPEAVRDFVTGNVKLDALVDLSGRVKSISVLAGPASLRSAAIEAVKQYKYAPATRNSTPVPAHVTLTVQFWYEP